jgi:hypothetical protein
MAKNDLDRARFVGAVTVYLGAVIATLVVGGLVGWALPMALDGELEASRSPLSNGHHAAEAAHVAHQNAAMDEVAAVSGARD